MKNNILLSSPDHRTVIDSRLAFFCIAIVPNIFFIDIKETAILRSYILIVVLAWMVYANRRALRDAWDHQGRLTKLGLGILLAFAFLPIAVSKSPLTGLFGSLVVPFGSLTLITTLAASILIGLKGEIRSIKKAFIYGAYISIAITSVMMLADVGAIGERFSGFFEHSLAQAIYIGVAGLFAAEHYLRTKDISKGVWVIPFLLFFAVGLSGSRLAIVTLFIALLILAWSYRKSPWHHSKSIVTGTTLIGFLLPVQIIPRLSNIGYVGESIQYRWSLIQRGIQMVIERPNGVGYGSIQDYFYTSTLPSWILEHYHRGILVGETHNFWLDVMIGYGVVIGVVVICLTWCLTHMCLRQYRSTQEVTSLAIIFVLVNLLLTPMSITTAIVLGTLAGVMLKMRPQ